MQVEWGESDKGELHGRENIEVTVKEVWGWLQAKWGEGINDMEKVVVVVMKSEASSWHGVYYKDNLKAFTIFSSIV